MDLSLDQFHGIISLLVACLELVLVLNLLIFAGKNYINKNIILIVTLLCVYQLFEFFICYFESDSKIILYLALSTITLLPPLSLKMTAGFMGFKGRIINLVFIPALFFIFYFPTVLDKLAFTGCTIFLASIEFPLGTVYGLFYYIPIVLSILIVYSAYSRSEGVMRRLLLILLTGYILTFLPAIIILLTIDQSAAYIESLMSKSALLLALTSSYVAIMNKEEQKGEQP